MREREREQESARERGRLSGVCVVCVCVHACVCACVCWGGQGNGSVMAFSEWGGKGRKGTCVCVVSVNVHWSLTLILSFLPLSDFTQGKSMKADINAAKTCTCIFHAEGAVLPTPTPTPEPDPCAEGPCRNGGTCNREAGGRYRCACRQHWEGQNCTTDTCECDSESNAPFDLCDLATRVAMGWCKDFGQPGWIHSNPSHWRVAVWVARDRSLATRVGRSKAKSGTRKNGTNSTSILNKL